MSKDMQELKSGVDSLGGMLAEFREIAIRLRADNERLRGELAEAQSIKADKQQLINERDDAIAIANREAESRNHEMQRWFQQKELLEAERDDARKEVERLTDSLNLAGKQITAAISALDWLSNDDPELEVNLKRIADGLRVAREYVGDDEAITSHAPLFRAVAEILDGCAHNPEIEPGRAIIHDVWEKFTAWVRDVSALPVAADEKEGGGK